MSLRLRTCGTDADGKGVTYFVDTKMKMGSSHKQFVTVGTGMSCLSNRSTGPPQVRVDSRVPTSFDTLCVSGSSGAEAWG